MPSYREYDQKTLDKLHEVELEILDDFDKICKENNLTYFLVYGSLLGAVRHSGFIPWDDDIDVGMMRADYDKFMKVGQELLDKYYKDKYYLDSFETNKDFYLPFAKIKMNGTIFDEVASANVEHHKGIYIDIFAFENIKNNKKFGKLRAFFIKTLLEASFYRNHIRKFKNLRHKWCSLLCCILPKKTMMKLQFKLMTKNKDNNSLYVNPLGGGYAYEKETHLRSTVLPVKKIKFAGKSYNGMNDNDTYLRETFGDDYMELPPVEKRRNHLPDRIEFKKENKNEK